MFSGSVDISMHLKVNEEWKYLHRAVDKGGNTVDFLLSVHRISQLRTVSAGLGPHFAGW